MEENVKALQDHKDNQGSEDFSAFADLSGFDVFTSDPATAPAGPMYVSPSRASAVLPPNDIRIISHEPATQAGNDALGTPTIIFVIAAIVALLAFGALLIAQPRAVSNIQQQLTSPSNATGFGAVNYTDAISTNPVGNSVGISDADASINGEDAFETLVTSYDKLLEYNDRIAECIQTYNGASLLRDRDIREQAANEAKAVMADIEQDITTVRSMNIGSASSLYSDYENVSRLQNDQLQRIAVIVESWDISLLYDAPFDHQAEIVAPLARDVGVSGVSIYLEDFDETYWTSRPQR